MAQQPDQGFNRSVPKPPAQGEQPSAEWLAWQKQLLEDRRAVEQGMSQPPPLPKPPGYQPPTYYRQQNAPPVWKSSALETPHHAPPPSQQPAERQHPSFITWPTALAVLILVAALYAYFSASSSYSGWWVPVVYAAFVTLDLAWLIYGIVMFVRGIGKDSGQMFGGILIIASAIAGPYLLFIAGLLNIVSRLK